MVSKSLTDPSLNTTPESAFNGDDHAQKVRAAWQGSVTQILKAGDLLAEAKAKLPHGRFGGWIRSIPLRERTAQRLMAISAYAPFRKHIASLPPTWTTLFELTHLSEEAFEASIKNGKIYPDMERQLAVRLSHEDARQDTHQDEVEEGSEVTAEDRIILALFKLHAEIRDNQNNTVIEVIREHNQSDTLVNGLTFVHDWLSSVIKALKGHRAIGACKGIKDA